MRKYVILPIIMLVLVVVGCSANSKTPSNELNSLKVSDVQEVKLSRSLQFGKVNESTLSVFTKQAEIELFIEAIDTAKKEEGTMDIRRPDYDVTLVTEDATHSIHLWLETDLNGGMYTLVSDTGTGYTLKEEAATKLKQLIMSIPYYSEQAKQNGDIVNAHGTFSNLDRWDEFLANIQSGTMDQVQITNYTVEGDPIFYNLNYDGESIVYTHDTTMDGFGSPQRVTAFCGAIATKPTEEATEYSLAGCQNGDGDISETFSLVIPKS